jgi:hypothetical protein
LGSNWWKNCLDLPSWRWNRRGSCNCWCPRIYITNYAQIMKFPDSSLLASNFPGKLQFSDNSVLHHYFSTWEYFIEDIIQLQLNKAAWFFKIHWPVSMRKGSIGFKPKNLVQPNIPSTWKVMEALYDSGKARAFGVSNFSSKKLVDLLKVARVPPPVD